MTEHYGVEYFDELINSGMTLNTMETAIIEQHIFEV